VCYAKIKPAALQCGEPANRDYKRRQAAGGRTEFGVGEKRRIADG
jgi:hypothetical protein